MFWHRCQPVLMLCARLCHLAETSRIMHAELMCFDNVIWIYLKSVLIDARTSCLYDSWHWQISGNYTFMQKFLIFIMSSSRKIRCVSYEAREHYYSDVFLSFQSSLNDLFRCSIMSWTKVRNRKRKTWTYNLSWNAFLVCCCFFTTATSVFVCSTSAKVCTHVYHIVYHLLGITAA